MKTIGRTEGGGLIVEVPADFAARLDRILVAGNELERAIEHFLPELGAKVETTPKKTGAQAQNAGARKAPSRLASRPSAQTPADAGKKAALSSGLRVSRGGVVGMTLDVVNESAVPLSLDSALSALKKKGVEVTGKYPSVKVGGHLCHLTETGRIQRVGRGLYARLGLVVKGGAPTQLRDRPIPDPDPIERIRRAQERINALG